MKINETLTIAQTVEMINGQTVGIFPTMILDGDSFFSLRYDLCLGYYMERSASKPISSTYRRLYELFNTQPLVTQTPDEMMGKIIRSKFIEKWEKQYNALIAEQYDVLSDYEHNETKQRVDTDTTSYDTTITNDGNTGTEMETTYSATDNDSIYGFNSTSAVPTDSTTSNSNDITSGASENNTRHNTETKDGTDTRNFDSDETREILGRRKSAPELIEKELDLRNREIFFDIIYTDIDSIATIGIYTLPQDEYNPIKEYILTAQSFTENGTYYAATYGADGFLSVTVKVEGGSGIIEVDELPTENIDTNAVYIKNDSLYRYINNEWIEYVSTTNALTTSDGELFIVKESE